MTEEYVEKEEIEDEGRISGKECTDFICTDLLKEEKLFLISCKNSLTVQNLDL